MIQNKVKIIGITGGIATGKSTASKILKEKYYKVIDADVIAREVLNVGEAAYNDLVDEFGLGILKDNKSIDRTALGGIIFKNESLRKKLNSITHPHIMRKIKEDVEKNNMEKILFLDIPLLIEVYDDLVDEGILIDEIWLVYCKRDMQIKRLMKRDGINYEFAESKVNAQMDIEEKKKHADKIIYNTKEKQDLIKELEYNLEQIS